MAKKAKVLIVDDEKDFCHFLKFNLENTKKYKVFVANSGQDGIKSTFQKKPDIVLLDILMPKMNGFEVLKQLKEDITTTSIPVVMLSALYDDESKIQAMSSYSHDYLVKPIRMDELTFKIDSILSRRVT